jgi:hypothetical protein
MDISRAQELLNVDPGTVSPRELRRAYHEQLRLHHPDLAQAGEETAARNEYTARLASAFRVLEIYLEEREKAAPLPPQDGLGGWSFSSEQPDWWPSEPPPRTSRNPRKSRPSSPRTAPIGIRRQRIFFLASGIAFVLLGVDWPTAIGCVLLLAIALSVWEGRVIEIWDDVLRPIARWAARKP